MKVVVQGSRALHGNARTGATVPAAQDRRPHPAPFLPRKTR